LGVECDPTDLTCIWVTVCPGKDFCRSNCMHGVSV
jgi:hypothetical protein